jgi:hypothetical protein
METHDLHVFVLRADGSQMYVSHVVKIQHVNIYIYIYILLYALQMHNRLPVKELSYTVMHVYMADDQEARIIK